MRVSLDAGLLVQGSMEPFPGPPAVTHDFSRRNGKTAATPSLTECGRTVPDPNLSLALIVCGMDYRGI